MRIGLAIQAFFRILFSAAFADQVRGIGSAAAPDEPSAQPPVVENPAPRKPSRSDAVTLLATLQREARFIDICKEPLSEYSDEQVGAAARDVLRECGETLDRIFGIHAVVDDDDGAAIETPAGYDPGRFRLTGNVQGNPPFHGTLVHHGWEAERCDLPQWTGKDEAALVVAPAEVEVNG